MKKKTLTEREYQKEVVKKIKEYVKPYDGDVIKNNPKQLQGIADWSVLANGKYALLEIKRDAKAPHRPNQDYRIERQKSRGAYASFLYPQNEDEVIDGLLDYLGIEKGEK